MPRGKKGTKKPAPKSGAAMKYDAHATALEDAYGMLADLRRELSDTREDVGEREDLLHIFSTCKDEQRSWLLLEDYFTKLKLSRKDFPGDEWWEDVAKVKGKKRLEALAVVFLRTGRQMPAELSRHANLKRFNEIEEAERERAVFTELENWMFPPAANHLDAPRASIQAVATPIPEDADSSLKTIKVEFIVRRPRTGDRKKSLENLMDLTVRAAHEQELFPASDWEFIEWVTECFAEDVNGEEDLILTGQKLLQWIAHWGGESRLQPAIDAPHYGFHGQLVEMVPTLKNGTSELAFTHVLRLPDGREMPLTDLIFFAGRPTIVLVENDFYFLRNSPPASLLSKWVSNPRAPINRLSTRFITELRRAHDADGVDWDSLCETHKAKPFFMFELHGDRLELRLQAKSENDDSLWEWNGHEWQVENKGKKRPAKPQVLEDPRLEAASQWLRKLDWFTPEPGLWVGDANENFLNVLACVWHERPQEAEFLGNDAFQRLYLKPKRLKPKLIVKGSGIDWLSVSAEWEEEGMKLTKRDLESLAQATGRFVKLPTKGWVELDVEATQKAQETMADLGLEGLEPGTQKIALEQAAHLGDESLTQFGDSKKAQKLRDRIKQFEGISTRDLPKGLDAELRPYQQEGFDFLCHLHGMGLGGILADDMGLGKTLQTLIYLAWLKQLKKRGKSNPSLVICPASVMHNWRRESEKFTPDMSVLVLESGNARHRKRKGIPDHDIIVTNYSLLRRDLEDLQNYRFNAIILDEAQFIKNPGAQVTQSVKQLKCKTRLALTGTPLENRLLDLWSITDFVQPNYLGDEKHFHEAYDPGGGDSEEAVANRRIARKRLSARLRPILLRRVKKQVAKDLPERIEQRHDCKLGKDQRKLYLAELRRSRDTVMETIQTKGMAKSRMQVLAALTRLRQICCHPSLVGNASLSGKTEALFDLLEPLVAQGEKVLVFSQFVQMLKILEKDCGTREIPTHMLTGETKNRQDMVNAFQDSEGAGVFLLSLRAAGTGLNLTTASYVVLYDPWWNPAVEAQAIDRTHRIGQTKTVNAYKLIAPGTVEEKIWNLQQSKQQTISDVLGEKGFAKSLDKTDLEFLFSED
jgi:SNF2 family DNA or RNA helicase